MSHNYFNESVFMSSTVSKRRPFRPDFNPGNKKKSQGTRSGEWGGWKVFGFWHKTGELTRLNEQAHCHSEWTMSCLTINRCKTPRGWLFELEAKALQVSVYLGGYNERSAANRALLRRNLKCSVIFWTYLVYCTIFEMRKSWIRLIKTLFVVN